MTTWVNAGLTNAALTGAMLGLGLDAPPATSPAGRRREASGARGWPGDAGETGRLPRYPDAYLPVQPTPAGSPVNLTDGFLAGSVTALASTTPAGWDSAAGAIGPWGEPTTLTPMPLTPADGPDLPEAAAPGRAAEPRAGTEHAPDPSAGEGVPGAVEASGPVPAEVTLEPGVLGADAVAALGGFAGLGGLGVDASLDEIAGPLRVGGLPDLADDPLGTGALDRSRLEPALLESELGSELSTGSGYTPTLAELVGFTGSHPVLDAPAEPTDRPGDPAAHRGPGPALGSLDSSSLFETLSRHSG